MHAADPGAWEGWEIIRVESGERGESPGLNGIVVMHAVGGNIFFQMPFSTPGPLDDQFKGESRP